jgi:hypothetical protein
MATNSIDDFPLAGTSNVSAQGIVTRTVLAAIRAAQRTVDRVLEISDRAERRARE